MTGSTGSISVRLFAGLESHTRECRTSCSFCRRETPTVGAVFAALGLRPEAAGLILVNGVHAGLGRALGAGDEVALFPPLGGG